MSEVAPVTILNVEDYRASRAATTSLLEQAGYQVMEAETGTEALRLAETGSPQLILLDVKLPDFSGYEVCQRLKADPRTALVPVLQISGSMVEGQDKVRGLESGADGYLVKPVSPAELLATIRALLRMRQAELCVRESEERLRLALDAAVLATWDFKVETDEIILGGHHAEIFGLSPAQQSISRAELLALIHPADQAAAEAALARALAEEEKYKQKFRLLHPTGEVRWLHAQGQIYRNEQSEPVRLVGVVRDVTERVQAEAERERLTTYSPLLLTQK